MPPYHTGRALAIAAGVTATAGALAILLADPIVSGAWRLDHGLLPITVFITIAAGHLAGAARRSGRWLSAAGFCLLFAVGTLLTIYASVGSQKAASGDKAAGIEAHNAQITDKQAEIGKARKRLDVANAEAEREMTGQKCGERCRNWRVRATEVQAHIRQLEAELAALGSLKSARPKAEAFAEVAGALGYDPRTVARLAQILEPFAFSLLLELTAIVAFGYGFAARRTVRSGETPATAAIETGKPNGSDLAPNVRRTVRRVTRVSKGEARTALMLDIATGKTFGSQDELAERFGRSKSTISEWLAEWTADGSLPPRRTIGRRKVLAGA